MPVRQENVDSAHAPPHAPVGVVNRIVAVPEPYDAQVNRVLSTLRARLFTLIEMGVPLEQQGIAKQEIRLATSDAINDVRRMLNIALGAPPHNGH